MHRRFVYDLYLNASGPAKVPVLCAFGSGASDFSVRAFMTNIDLPVRAQAMRCRCRFGAPWLFFVLGLFLAGCAEQIDPVTDAGPGGNAFQPVPDLATGHVAWHAWSNLDSARVLSRPVFLFLYTRRSYWCREMAARCFGDPDLAGELSRGTFPIRVDADCRPDLAERFGMGGWPSAVFLTPEGEWVTGSTYMDPSDLRLLLRRVRVYFDVPERREDLARQQMRLKAREALETRPVRYLEPSPVVLGRLADSARVAIARGENPGGESFLLLLEYGRLAGEKGAEEAALSGLNRLASGPLRDGDGAFFLAPLTPDAVLADREKPLASNAGLLAAFSQAARQTGQAVYRKVALELGKALLSWSYAPSDSLFEAGLTGFAGVDTTDSGEKGYALLTEGMTPFRDGAIYAGWNGLAVSAFLALHRVAPGKGYGAVGRQAMDALQRRLRLRDGGVGHVSCAPEKMPLLLADQALVARAALDLYDMEGRPEDLQYARDLAGVMLKRFGNGTGALRDWVSEPGSVQSPAVDGLLPSANGVAVQVFLRLYAVDGRDIYREASGRILETLVGTHIHQAAYLGALGRGLTVFLRDAYAGRAE